MRVKGRADEVVTSFNSSWSGFVISFCFPLFFWIATCPLNRSEGV